MNQASSKNVRKMIFGVLSFVPVIAILTYFLQGKTLNAEAMKEARRILPGYSVVFEGHTNVIQRCGSLRAFSRQHAMMEYLQTFAPNVEQYNHILHEQCITRCQLSQYIAPLPLEHNFDLPKET